MKDLKRIIISRTDSIGDVILTLPLAGILKRKYPRSKLVFLGRSYTEEVIAACKHIDSFLDWDEISRAGRHEGISMLASVEADLIIHVFPRREIALMARKAMIPYRLGTTNRLYHWGNCNRLVRLSRRKSELHEAQLNIKLASGITGIKNLSLPEIGEMYGLNNTAPLNDDFKALIDPARKNIILHPKSKGSAREWGVENFMKLIELLPEDRYKIFVSGTREEGELLDPSGIFEHTKVTNICGMMSLGQFMSFIRVCDSLVAASTGPLHLAAALGIRAVGIYPPIRPMHPGRWAPLGPKASFLVKGKNCTDCSSGSKCTCMEEIEAVSVKKLLEEEFVGH
ncbi:MAG: glycosyltransferase family 9 protein [Bacteroidales bacterium]|jgi:ADP-heptose:LPS heptosyltransferase|nr:glycosyltransferase family 9 protein [Bacteroidales bacterium]